MKKLLIALVVLLTALPVLGAVNLKLAETGTNQVTLYASSPEQDRILAMDVALTWSSGALGAISVQSASPVWEWAGFPASPVNQDLADGSAAFEAYLQWGPTPTPIVVPNAWTPYAVFGFSGPGPGSVDIARYILTNDDYWETRVYPADGTLENLLGTFTGTEVTPEPSGLLVLCAGVAGLLVRRR